MTATSPVNAIQYPDLTNVKDQVAQFATLNTNVDTSVVPRMANASDRGTRITSPVEGQLAYLTQESVLQKYDGTSWQTAEIERIAIKTSNEVISATTTAINTDDQLYFYAEANSVYRWELVMFYSGSTTTNAIFAGFAVPSGATLRQSMMVQAAGQSNINSCTVRVGNVGGNTMTTSGWHTSASYSAAWLAQGTVRTSSTPGLVQLNWAKPTAYAGNLTVLAGSFLNYCKIS